jgi:S-DNA-T family DNA segregation ATPase FtsK/SpoIIIE
VTVFRYHRPPRHPGPEYPAGETVLEGPPTLPLESGRRGSLLLVLPMLAGSAAMAVMFTQRSGALGYVTGAMFGVAMLGFAAQTFTVRSPSRSELSNQRRMYLRYLSRVRTQVRRAMDQQRTAAEWRHPAPGLLWSVARPPRLWERRRGDDDFGVLRLARGVQQTAVKLVPPQTQPIEDLDPMSAVGLRRFIQSHASVSDMPIAMDARSFSHVWLNGERAEVLGLARAMVGHAVVFHAPEDLRIAVLAPADRHPDWEWVKWLPHVADRNVVDAGGPRRLVFETIADLESRLDDELAFRPRHQGEGPHFVEAPHLLVLVDGVDGAGGEYLRDDGLMGVTTLRLGSMPPRLPGRAHLVLDAGPDSLHVRQRDSTTALGRPDSLGAAAAEALARRVARYRLSEGLDDVMLAAPPSLVQLISWHGGGAAAGPTSLRDQLSVPIGQRVDGAPLRIDLKQAAHDGMGPHGLVVGAHGSGKSDLLATIVLGLAVAHPPAEVAFLLVDATGIADGRHQAPRPDRAGNGIVDGLGGLPHVAGAVPAAQLDMFGVRRLCTAVAEELARRQEILRAASYPTHADHWQAHRRGTVSEPLPVLVLVVDEFPELLGSRPFIDMLVSVARLGRSLGVHLLLSATRVDEEAIRSLSSYLSYRIVLRTASAADSIAVLGGPDAHELPPAPGNGYLRVAPEDPIRLRTAHSGAAWSVPRSAPARRQPSRFNLGYSAAPDITDGGAALEADRPDVPVQTVLEVVVAGFDAARSVSPVWAPPPSAPVTLDELLPRLEVDASRGLRPVGSTGSHRFAVPVGLEDDPRGRGTAYHVDLTGNLVIVGGPGSGKTTLLLTVVGAAALVRMPTELSIYCVDVGDGSLGALRGLPHVAAVAAGGDGAMLDALVRELLEMATLREQTAAAGQRNTPLVLLAVDGWARLRREFPPWFEQAIGELAARGPAVGMYVVITCDGWRPLRAALTAHLAAQIELRLTDPAESEIDRRAAAELPTNASGRCLVAGGRHLFAALPRIDGGTDPADVGRGVADLVDRVRTAWQRSSTAQSRARSQDLSAVDLIGDWQGGPHSVALGLTAEGSTVALDFGVEQHLIVLGATGSGKTSLTRLVTRQLGQHATAKVLLVDYRNTFGDAVPAPHVFGHATTPDELRHLLGSAQSTLRRRLPSEADQAFTAPGRSPANPVGDPRLFLVVDDYEQVALNPVLHQILDLLPHARDIGLHVVLARHSTGAGTAIYDPFLQRLREGGAVGLVLDARPNDGPLFGVSRPERQPVGRGVLVRPDGEAETVQLARCDPSFD